MKSRKHVFSVYSGIHLIFGSVCLVEWSELIVVFVFELQFNTDTISGYQFRTKFCWANEIIGFCIFSDFDILLFDWVWLSKHIVCEG
jgi:hypothetical protein